ncbi:DUF4245 domain-containing protein [Gordonia sp. (in: high G+C Gram-positive bacteria)]|uniref:DUF4245 domain-containing protein n=1 Tax=Gordonia sp. (in: high G+C Gram-positive bacteria) TaxID=84139 RepID=UPI0016B24E81|nr:DUF4245 domain-containing protein [Gordonia sp. (in: high G+C Gram-positive bacteria)]NLG46124.1 DUF4245 domain-containing protein [Gordonia sp. (in: high G+C Gram-positive bacteria)]
MADKPRILHDGKDLIWSLIPLMVIALVVAGVSGSCSWGFGDSATHQNVPTFDVKAGLQADADTMPFPIRQPEVPADWKANSGSTAQIGNSLASNVGWITPDGVYVQLTQTAATEDELVFKLLAESATGAGVRDIDGHPWVQYTGEGERRAWITDLGDVRIGVVSRGRDATMDILAKAVVAAQPLPANRNRP